MALALAVLCAGCGDCPATSPPSGAECADGAGGRGCRYPIEVMNAPVDAVPQFTCSSSEDWYDQYCNGPDGTPPFEVAGGTSWPILLHGWGYFLSFDQEGDGARFCRSYGTDTDHEGCLPAYECARSGTLTFDPDDPSGRAELDVVFPGDQTVYVVW